MRATVAYEASRRKKPLVKQLKWHKWPHGLYANGVKGEYTIRAEKPNRRIGCFKWHLYLNTGDEKRENINHVEVNGKPMSLDDLSELKAFASSYDAIPSGTVIAVNEDRPAREGGPAREAPTREEWEVVVHHPPAGNKGAILNMAGPGDGFEAGNKIILQGFHDDTTASNVAASIAHRYKVPVTTGPIRKSTDANEGSANEAPRRRSDEDRRYPLKWTDTPRGNSFAHGAQGSYYVTQAATRSDSWMLVGPNAVDLGAFRSKQQAEDEAERVEFIERRNVRARRDFDDDSPSSRGAYEAHDSHAPGEACGCEPFTKVTKDPQKFKICVDRANRIGPLNTPRKIYELVAPDIANLPYEEFFVLGIGAHGKLEGKLITYAKVAQGGQHKVAVETEEIIRVLVADRPDVYILVHSHPSGDATPSDADISMTKSLREGVAKALPGCVYGDHVIVCSTEFFSMRANKKFKA